MEQRGGGGESRESSSMGGEGDRTRYCEEGKILGCIIANDMDDFSIILKLPQIKVSPNQKSSHPGPKTG